MWGEIRGWGNLFNGDLSVSMDGQGLTVFEVLNNTKFYYCWGQQAVE
jgi:hypothetical protein